MDLLRVFSNKATPKEVAKEILPLLEAIMQESGKLLIVCDDIEGEASPALIANIPIKNIKSR